MFHRLKLVLLFFIPLIAGVHGVARADLTTDANTLASKAYADTKVSATQSTGYQVLTTGTSGAVAPAYLTIPVTTAASGKPTSNNAPISAAAVWIE